MLKLFNKKKKDNKGFTLVELVIVIAILAILVGLLAPQYVKYVEKSRKSADATNIENVVSAIKVAAADEDFGGLTAGDYKVTLSSEGMTVTGSEASLTADDKGALTAALIEYMGAAKPNEIIYSAGKAEFKNVVLKSSKWNPATPSATATVSDTGAVSVSYSPTTLATGKNTTN